MNLYYLQIQEAVNAAQPSDVISIGPGTYHEQIDVPLVKAGITLAGSAFLAFIAVFPQLIHSSLDVDVNVAYLYGGTSLLIVVGVALEMVQKIEAHLLMRHYEGFMKRGRVRSRSS
jgi:cytochrome bd-type quinol oxidase subunit 2